MTSGGSSNEALIIGSAFMADVGALFPVSVQLRGHEFDFTFMMRASALGHRTVGPYTSDHPPADAVTWAQLRMGAGMAGRFPRFHIDASGQWARIHVELMGTAVRAIIVMPEEVTAESLNAPYLGEWQEQISSPIRIAFDRIAGWLAQAHQVGGGAEPLIDINLVYRADERYEARLAKTHEQVREFIPPVQPILELDWRSVTSSQRKAFLKAVTSLKGAERTGRFGERKLRCRIGDVTVELPA